jgi:ribosomal protein L7/L12
MTKNELLEEINNLSVNDLKEVAKVIIDRLGMNSGPFIGPVAYGAPLEDDESNTVDVILESVSDLKISTIKATKNLSFILGKNISLKEAKNIVDRVPVVLAEGVDTETAKKIIAEYDGSTGTKDTGAKIVTKKHIAVENIMMDEYIPGGCCSECSPQIRLKLRTQLLCEALDKLPSELQARVKEELSKHT